MAAVQTYAADLVTVIFGGIPIQGFIDGSFVEADTDDDRYVKSTGADGRTSRARTGNRAGRVTIRLQQTSLSNAYLSSILELDDATNQGVLPLLIKDLSGADVIFAQSAWIVKPPAIVYSKGIEGREWLLDCGDLKIAALGNPVT